MKGNILKSVLALMIALGIGISQSQAQGRVIIKLDGNKVPVVNENFGTHRYTQILSTTPDSTSISKLYDLQNRLLSLTKEKYNKELGYNEALTSTYDTLQNLISSEIRNVENGSFVKVFLDNQIVVSRLEHMAERDYRFYLGNDTTPTIQSEENPMEPQANFDMNEYHSFLAKNLKYPLQARERREMGTVLVKIDFDDTGEISEISCLNPQELYPPLINEAIRVVKAFNPTFIPPIDIYGNKTSFMARLPIRFKLS